MFHGSLRLTRSRLPSWAVIIAAAIWPGAGHGAAAAPAPLPTYTNPVMVTIPTGGVVESCADPSVVRGAGDDRTGMPSVPPTRSTAAIETQGAASTFT